MAFVVQNRPLATSKHAFGVVAGLFHAKVEKVRFRKMLEFARKFANYGINSDLKIKELLKMGPLNLFYLRGPCSIFTQNRHYTNGKPLFALAECRFHGEIVY